MSEIKVDISTLRNLSNEVRTENEKLINIISDISKYTLEYQNMLISDAGELYREFVINDIEKEKEKILANNVEIADKLSSISDIYEEVKEDIGGMMK